MTLPTLQTMNAKLNHAGADYPHGKPYQAPPAVSSKRWFAALLGAVALLMVVNVAAVVILMQRNQHATAASGQPEAPVANLKPTPGSAELPAFSQVAAALDNRSAPQAEV